MSHLEGEIQEQPAVVDLVLTRERQNAAALAAEMRRRAVRYVVIAARGSSDNAATYGKYLLGAFCRLPVVLATPSLFTIYQAPPLMEGALVLGISQSGQSPDIVSVLAEARSMGVLTAAITNEPASPLAGAADFLIQCHAGAERSVAATKTYTAQLAALALLAASWADAPALLRQLELAPGYMGDTLALHSRQLNLAERYRYMESCVLIGRGYNIATAFEVALKLKELTYVLAEPYSSADFMHGPLALVGQGFPAWVIAPSGQVFPEMLEFIGRLRQRGAELVVVSDQDAALDLAHTRLSLPAGVPEWLSPLTAVIPGQLMALGLTLAKGYDPDHPRGLRKVTETL